MSSRTLWHSNVSQAQQSLTFWPSVRGLESKFLLTYLTKPDRKIESWILSPQIMRSLNLELRVLLIYQATFVERIGHIRFRARMTHGTDTQPKALALLKRLPKPLIITFWKVFPTLQNSDRLISYIRGRRLVLFHESKFKNFGQMLR